MKKLLVMLAVLSGLCFLNTACSDSDDSSSSTGTAVDEGVKYLNYSFNEFTFGETNKNWSKLSDGWKKYSCSEDSMKGRYTAIFYPSKMNGGFSVTVKKESGYNGGGYGVVFGAAGDTKNYYNFKISVKGNSKTLQIKNGTSTDLTGWIKTKSIKTGYNVENKITVAKENGKYAIYVNDEFVYLIEDSEYTGGYVGFYASVDEYDTPSETPVVEYFKFNELNTDNKTVVDGGMNYCYPTDTGIDDVVFCSHPYLSKLSDGWIKYYVDDDNRIGKGNWFFYPKSPVKSFTARIKKESGVASGPLYLFFSGADKKNSYHIQFNLNGNCAVCKTVDGTKTVLNTWDTLSAIKTGYNQENEISVARLGDRYDFDISINGTKVYTIEGTPELCDAYVGFQVNVSSTDTPSTTPVVAYCKFTAIN